MTIDLNNLPSSLTDLHNIISVLLEENASLKHQLALLKQRYFGSSSEKAQKEIEDLELRIEEVETIIPADTDENVDDDASSTDECRRNGSNESRKRKGTKQPKRKALPEHLPREEEVHHPASTCPECGSHTFRKISDDVSETLEYVPASFKVIRHVRPRHACTQCETIVQAPPPSQTIAKGKAGAGLLAHICINKYCDSLPFYRQSQRFEREGIALARSSMANWAGKCATLLEPLVQEIQKTVFAASHIHGDDTTIPVLAPGVGKTKIGRLWAYVSDGRAYGDEAPMAACYFYSPDRKGERPAQHLSGFTGVFHADAYSGYNQLYQTGDIVEAGCWAHARRKFHEITVASPNAKMATQTLDRIGEIYHIEDDIRGKDPSIRLRVREAQSKPLVDALYTWGGMRF